MKPLEEQEFKKLVSQVGLDPMVRKVFLEVPEPNLKDNRGDLDRVLDVLDKQESIPRPFVSLPMVQKIAEALYASHFRVTLTLGYRRAGWEVLDIEGGDQRALNYGLAVDLGSTNMIYYLLDLNRGEIAARVDDENPQVRHGEDILSRIHYCEQDGGLQELQDMVIRAFNRNIDKLLRESRIQRRHLYALAVAGNTTMTHFFLGLSPHRICREPYTPLVNRPGVYDAHSLGLEVNENALLYTLPNVGSYVGGDVLAGILVSGMHQEEEPCILVDVGTNVEIILGNRHWIMVAAGAAGPALEGGVVRCGMRAADGAIEKVRIDRKTHASAYHTIGGEAPRGICGSGLIDLMAELFSSGLVDERGKIVSGSEFVSEADGVKSYRVVSAEESGTGSEIVLTELDINNLLRTKGAMYTALTVMIRNAGLSFQDLRCFYVAGTFGAYIDPVMAVTIGMVPDIPLEKFMPLYNSAGTGCCLCLISNAKRQELDEISRRITYVELNVDGDFMNLLSAAMFLPHTDISQFPSVLLPDREPGNGS